MLHSLYTHLVSSDLKTQSFKRAPFAVPLLLGLLEAQPQHGYALFKTIEADLRGVCHIGMNRLYALLDEMAQAGLTNAHADASAHGPTRNTYHLTAKGRRQLHAWLEAPCPTMREMRVDFPPKLYLARQRGPAAVARLIITQREACERELMRMSTQQRAVRGKDDYLPAIYAFRVGQIKAGIRWLDQCERNLKQTAVLA